MAAPFKSLPHKAYFTNSSRNSHPFEDESGRVVRTGTNYPMETLSIFISGINRERARRNRNASQSRVLCPFASENGEKEADRTAGISAISFCTPLLPPPREKIECLALWPFLRLVISRSLILVLMKIIMLSSPSTRGRQGRGQTRLVGRSV